MSYKISVGHLKLMFPLPRLKFVNGLKECCRSYAKVKGSKSSVNHKISQDVVKYIRSPEFDSVRDELPDYLLKRFLTPGVTYIASPKTAQEIVNICGSKVTKNDVVLEMNPGVGVLTEKLLQTFENDIYLFETHTMFRSHITKLQEKYPGRLHYRIGDFLEMWKLVFQDKQDNGNRVQELLGELTKASEGKTVKIFGSMPRLNFIKHLTFTQLFQSEKHPLGKPELYVVTSGEHLSFLKNDGTVKQRGGFKVFPAMFRLIFDFKIIKKLPRANFLPWSHVKIKSAMRDDYDLLYLVQIIYKDRLPCKQEHLPLLWFFFQNQINTLSNRVIPNMERWIPGAGVWLITGQDPPYTNKELSPDEFDEPLPHMTIFTTYKDLTMGQIVTIFKRFISWPEFEQCPFRMTMEQSLPRAVFVSDKDENVRTSAVEDDSDAEDDIEDEKSEL